MKGIKERISAVLPGPDDERGQVIVIVALSFVVLLALVGLTIDAGLIYVGYTRLRRAIDASAVSAVNQYREGRTASELYAAVVETMELQLPGVRDIRFYWCSSGGVDMVEHAPGEYYDAHDPELCTTPRRKLVRVEARLPVELTFISLVWRDEIILSARTQAEAAVLNMVLLLDTSESMAYTTCDPGLEEPEFFACIEACRAAGNCQPFDSTNVPAEPSVRWAAHQFVDTLMRDGVDRVAVYHFDKTPVLTQSVEMYTCLDPMTMTVPITLPTSSGRVIELSNDKHAVLEAIDTGQGIPSHPLNVYVRPPACDAQTGECCTYPTHVGGYVGEEGMGYGYRWASTNVGGGLREAVTELVMNGNTDAAIWVIVVLSDGAANATDQASDENSWWTCPSPSGSPNYRNRYLNAPFCRDPEHDGVVTRHCPSQEVCDREEPWYTNANFNYQEWLYDADDYARDIADLASSQQVAVYTIGFGPKVINANPNRGRPDAGERLLRYIADVGDDGDVETAPCGSDYYWDDVVVDPIPSPGEDCGNYYYAETAGDLVNVFEDIVSRIFSRITE